MTQDHELKPCPFCGKEANYEEEQDVISCMNTEGGCGFYYESSGYSLKELIKAWNTRASERRLSEEKLRDLVRDLDPHGAPKKIAQAIIYAYNSGELWDQDHDEFSEIDGKYVEDLIEDYDLKIKVKKCIYQS